MGVQRGGSGRSIFLRGKCGVQLCKLVRPVWLILIERIGKTAPADISGEDFLLFRAGLQALKLQLLQEMDSCYICPKLCFCAADAEGIIGDAKILRVAVACRLEVGVSGLLRSGDAGKVLPLAVNGDGYRRAGCGRLVYLGLRDGIIKVRHKLAHFRKRRAAFLLQNQRVFLTHGGRFRLGGFCGGRVMLRFRDMKRLDFYVIGQMRFLGRIERHGFGDGLLLRRCIRGEQMGIALILAQQRGKPFLAFHAEDGICL